VSKHYSGTMSDIVTAIVADLVEEGIISPPPVDGDNPQLMVASTSLAKEQEKDE